MNSVIMKTSVIFSRHLGKLEELGKDGPLVKLKGQRRTDYVYFYTDQFATGLNFTRKSCY